MATDSMWQEYTGKCIACRLNVIYGNTINISNGKYGRFGLFLCACIYICVIYTNKYLAEVNIWLFRFSENGCHLWRRAHFTEEQNHLLCWLFVLAVKFTKIYDIRLCVRMSSLRRCSFMSLGESRSAIWTHASSLNYLHFSWRPDKSLPIAVTGDS